MAICLNPQCQKIVPNESVKCSACGGETLYKFRMYQPPENIEEQISMESFQRALKHTKPIRERVPTEHSGIGSFKSKVAVRIQFITRKLFSRRYRPRRKRF
jgi:heterodisulfide reductase subunit B